ncbi:MAG: RNA methyltransferase [Ktedonobacterales bacterium]|nr:RNA methyltransferase [Ktedonobacterales bacterium]
MEPFGQTITSLHNPKVGALRALQTSKGRRAARAFLAEGVHLVTEAHAAHIQPDLVIYDPTALDGAPLLDVLGVWAAEGVEVVAATPTIMERVCDAQTPQGVAAVINLDRVTAERMNARRRGRFRPLLLILDDIADPGNVGTILRSALAADVDTVLLTPNCVDAFAPKVVRAASGAHFHLPLRPEQSWAQIEAQLAGAPHMQQVLVADAAGDTDYSALDLTQRTGLIIGNETRGPSVAARSRATRQVRIPMYNHVESLNAGIAASVILFEAVRQRRATEK